MSSIRIALVVAVLCGPLSAYGQLNVSEVGNFPGYSWNNDVWGFSLGGVEVALMGTRTGTSIINVTNPAAPSEIAFIPGPHSIWRDIKTYAKYAYVTNETGEGFQVIDLSDPLAPVLVKSDSTWFSTAHNVFAAPDGKLYFPGSNAPGMVVLDASLDPANPVYAGTFNDSYVHDIYVEGGYGYAGLVYNGQLAVLDVSDPSNITVTDAITTGGAFTHNTWLTSDGNYCLTTDENSSGHIEIYDVQDPNNIAYVAEWKNPDDPLSIVHNVTVLGDHAFVSWYRAGLQVLDLSDPRFPQRVGYYDTYPGSGSGFQGAWGVYPYIPSGNIYISDINSGFYALEFTPDYGWIIGTVTDSVTTAELEDVEVSIAYEGRTVHTTDAGYYQFSLPDSSSYMVYFSKFGYLPDSLDLSVSDAGYSEGSIELTPLPMGEIQGYVGEYGAYLPLNNVLVTLDGTPLEAATGADGKYVISGVPSGNYTLSVDHFGYTPETRPVSVSTGQVSHINYALYAAVFVDDLEDSTGAWTIGAPGDAATTGVWEWADPLPTAAGNVQPDDDHTPAPGTHCFVTGASGGEGSSVGQDDVDGGATSLVSPVIDLSGVTDPVLRYYRWFLNDAGSNPGQDAFVAYASSDAGSTWVQVESTVVSNHAWQAVEYDIGSYITPTSETRFKFKASDTHGAVVEALIDDVEVLTTGTVVSVPQDKLIARMMPATPNPFRHSTAVRFTLEKRADVRLDVFALDGRKIATLHHGILDEGSHLVPWSGLNDRGQNVAGGVYFVRLAHEGGSVRQKIVLAR